jgi:hypothetical protein
METKGIIKIIFEFTKQLIDSVIALQNYPSLEGSEFLKPTLNEMLHYRKISLNMAYVYLINNGYSVVDLLENQGSKNIGFKEGILKDQLSYSLSSEAILLRINDLEKKILGEIIAIGQAKSSFEGSTKNLLVSIQMDVSRNIETLYELVYYLNIKRFN